MTARVADNASPAPAGVREQDLVQSGGFGRSTNSARAGFLPIGLQHVPIGALEGIPVYIRVKSDDAYSQAQTEAEAASGFRLYCAETVRFAEIHRARLIEHGVRFIYVRMADQSRFRRQTESRLLEITSDPAVAIAEKSTIIYETSVELMNELLAEPDIIVQSPRLEQVSRAVTMLVMNDPSAFTHLFAASHHDFYTATHMVNVATWMVPLAYELGHRDPDELNRICQAGILHDMGKTEVAEEILNKQGKLSEDDWAAIRRHPVAGCEYLSRFGHIDEIVLKVTRQHHERLDGTGYPDGLKGDQIDRISRICAVVDSFDAMTAFRPFKERTLSVQQAMQILKKETPHKYDAEVFEAWLKLMKRAGEVTSLSEPAPRPAALLSNLASLQSRRKHPRKTFHCPARAHVLVDGANGLKEQPGMPVVAHSISRSGLGFLSQVPIRPAEYVRVYMQAKGWDGRALEGQTVRCRTHNDRWHEIGMEFTNVAEEGKVPADVVVGEGK